MDYGRLKTEITTDPAGLGYAGKTDQQIADIMNTRNRSVNRITVPAYEVWEAIVPAEWAAVSAQEKQRVQTILSMGTVSVLGANTRASFAAAFAAGTTTRANLVALQTELKTRGEELGLGRISAGHVAKARLAA